MSENQQTGKLMKRKNPYMILDVTPFRDQRLSWKAKGLMTYFLDKPEGWTFVLEHLYKQSPDGEKSVRTGLKELSKYGYLVRAAYRKDKKIDHFGFLVYEEPVAFPSTSPVHVDLEKWDKHLKNGGNIDITLFAQKGKVGKPLDKSLLAQNQQVGKQHVGNAGLVITNDSKDDDATAGSSVSEWDKDFQYMAFRQQFTSVGGSDIRKHSEHYSKYLEAKNNVGFGKLCELADEYIKAVQAGEHPHKSRGVQILWFLSDGWQNFGQSSGSNKGFKENKKTQDSPRRKLRIVCADE